ncbi:hypothetical protein [Levilactobacillus zymae]|uniref:hypothetical protein n=1 Tax=Levilactobacillus zymae TaxID=267363 RepID=UPI0028BB49EC|nr:hypothetical protein [Levilactobacillus zymae]MDT6981666.1 hypothetical protein [Levilactobacillus zymae]
MIDINYGNYTLFQYLIMVFILFPIEIIHSWLIIIIYAAIVLIIFSTLLKLFERRHPRFKENNHVTTVPWLRTTLAVLSTAMFFVILLIKDSSVDFLTYYALIAAPHVISAYFSTSRRAHF